MPCGYGFSIARAYRKLGKTRQAILKRGNVNLNKPRKQIKL